MSKDVTFAGLTVSVGAIAATLSLVSGTLIGLSDSVEAWKNTEDYGNKDNFGGRLKSSEANSE